MGWSSGVACSLPPSLEEFIHYKHFMTTGFNLLGIDSFVSKWLIIPAQIAMAFVFFLPCCKLLHAIALEIGDYICIHHFHISCDVFGEYLYS
jgi:hypothetical protein